MVSFIRQFSCICVVAHRFDYLTAIYLELLAYRSRCLFATLLWKEHSVDVGQDTTLCNRHTRQEFAQLLVIPHGQLDVARNDTAFLVVACGITRQFQNLSSQVFEDSSHVHRCTRTNAFCRQIKLISKCHSKRLRNTQNLVSKMNIGFLHSSRSR